MRECLGLIWGCTNATQLNGQVLYTNGSTNLSQVVGTLYNTQQTALTLTNVANTADTTCLIHGQGWNPFPGAPFPAPDAPSCTNGNGSPGCAVGDGINTWANDFSAPVRRAHQCRALRADRADVEPLHRQFPCLAWFPHSPEKATTSCISLPDSAPEAISIA